jgi:hypothetical protein
MGQPHRAASLRVREQRAPSTEGVASPESQKIALKSKRSRDSIK